MRTQATGRVGIFLMVEFQVRKEGRVDFGMPVKENVRDR